MSFPSYDNYVDSENPFLGKLPSHWTLRRLSTVCYFESGKAHEPFVDEDGDFICVNSRFVSTQGEAEKRCTKNLSPTNQDDILMVMSDLPNGRALARAFYVADNRPYAVNQRVCIVRVLEAVPRYVFYYLDRNPQFLWYDDGFNQTHLSNSTFTKFPLVLPPLPEQRSIAAFLDAETSKIDALVAEQRRLIELLKEKRQAVISHAVTKGLNPHVKMKPSGIDWLGDVPEHWITMPIRYAARIESGHTPSRQRPEWWVDCKYPWISLSDVWQFRDETSKYIYETKEKVSDLGLANSAARLLPKGTVVLSRTASVGFSGIMGCDMATTQDFANWVCSCRLLPEYLLLVFRAMKSEFERLKYGSTHNTIYMPGIIGLRFALPPMSEQQRIIEYVDERLKSFECLISEAERSVHILQERRTALISAAVTGKIDVRGFVPKEASA